MGAIIIRLAATTGRVIVLYHEKGGDNVLLISGSCRALPAGITGGVTGVGRI